MVVLKLQIIGQSIYVHVFNSCPNKATREKLTMYKSYFLIFDFLQVTIMVIMLKTCLKKNCALFIILNVLT